MYKNTQAKGNFGKKSYFRGGDSNQSGQKPSFLSRPNNNTGRPSNMSRPTSNARFGDQSGTPKFRSRSNFNQSARSPRKRMGENIDISRFISKPTEKFEEKAISISNSFADFALCEEIQKNLINKNYTTPTPIQDQSINHILEGNDLIGLANTGTGKTAAFLLPLINKIYKNRSEKVLILAPTRELALQIDNEFRQFSWGMKIFSAACVGGTPIHKQINNLKRSPNFVIGTPGRLKDLSERNQIQFSSFNNIVIDEIDRMLDMGFIDEIKRILGQLPEKRQSLFFSATMPDKIRELTSKFLVNPVIVQIKQRETAENVDQDIVRIRDRAIKFNQLEEVLRGIDVKKALIFSETKRDVEKLTNNLNESGFKAESIHGDKRQSQRQRALTLFKNNQVDILVATDVAARGLDIKDISHVINYTVPQTYNDYIHRIGRTGRGDKKGKALTFVEA